MNEELDKYHGHGGAYVVDAPGQPMRQLEAPTQDHPEGNCARDADHMPLIGGFRKDDLDLAIETLHKKHGRSPSAADVQAEVKRILPQRRAERLKAAKATAAVAAQASAAAASVDEKSDKKARS